MHFVTAVDETIQDISWRLNPRDMLDHGLKLERKRKRQLAAARWRHAGIL